MCCGPKAGTCAPSRCTSASGCYAACSRSAARCSSPSTGTPTARPTTGRPAAGAGRASSPSGPIRPTGPAGTRDWLKFKCLNGQEFVIGGFTDPQGTRTGFGALLLGYYDHDGQLIYAGKVGTGFDRPTLTSLHAALAAAERPAPPFAPGRSLPRSRVHWVEPRTVAQVGFSEWTPDGELRHPRFQGLRRDKDPADVVREMP